MSRDIASKVLWNTRPEDLLGVIGTSGIDWLETNTPLRAIGPRYEETICEPNLFILGRVVILIRRFCEFSVYKGEFNRVKLSRYVLEYAPAAVWQPELRGVGDLSVGEPVPYLESFAFLEKAK